MKENGGGTPQCVHRDNFEDEIRISLSKMRKNSEERHERTVLNHCIVNLPAPFSAIPASCRKTQIREINIHFQYGSQATGRFLTD